MAVDPEVEHRECADVDDAQTVRLTGLERDGRVLVEADGGGCTGGVGTRNRPEVRRVLGEVDEGRVYGDNSIGVLECQG